MIELRLPGLGRIYCRDEDALLRDCVTRDGVPISHVSAATGKYYELLDHTIRDLIERKEL